jgi:hypothetical protein
VTSTPIRRATAAAAALSLSFVLAACGGGDEETADDPTTAESSDTESSESPETDETDEPTTEPAGTVLTEEQLASALLTAEDLPGGYVLEPEDDSEEDGGGFEGSCLEDIGDLTDNEEFESDEEAEAAFLLEGDAGQSSVESGVESYADEQQVIDALASFSEVVSGCTESSGTDEDGLQFDLQIESDQTVSLEGVDEQARVAVEGTITTQGLELPVLFGFNVARIGNNIVTIATSDIGEVGEGIVPQTDAVAQVSVDRLAEITG